MDPVVVRVRSLGRSERTLGMVALGLAVLAVALAMAPGAAAQAREGLENPGVEGAANLDNGFLLFYTAEQASSAAPCPVAPTPPAGPTLDDCSVLLAPIGPAPTAYSAYGGVRFKLAHGTRLADLQGLAVAYNAPNGVDPLLGAHLHTFLRIDSTGTAGVPDRCLVIGSTYYLPAAPTGGWATATLVDAASPTQMWTDSAANACNGGPATSPMRAVQASYPAGEVLSAYVQLVSGAANWPPGNEVYVDGFSATLGQSASVLAWEGEKLEVDENTLSSDTYEVQLGRPPAAGETVTVTPVENIPPGGFQQLDFSPASLTFTQGNWDVRQTVTVTAVRDYVYNGGPSRQITLTHATASSSRTSAFDNLRGPVVPVTVVEADVPGIVQEVPPPAAPPDRIDLDEMDPATTASYDVFVGTAPLPGETIDITIDAGGQATVDVDPATPGDQDVLTLDASNWRGRHPVLVTVVDDLVDEAHPHTQPISATSASNIPTSSYNGATANAIMAVIRDDDPLVSLGAVQDATEGGPDGWFTLTRGPDTSSPVTVFYSVAATSTATNSCGPGDLCPTLSGSAIIPGGSPSIQVPVSAVVDGVNEVTESVDVTLRVETCGCSVAAGTSQVLILDMDQPSVSVAWVSDADEETGADGVFRLYRSNADLPIDVRYSLSGAPASTYAASPLSPPGVHFAAGEFTADLLIDPVNDSDDDPPKEVTVTLLDDTGVPDTYNLAPPPFGTATLYIVGNDPPTVQVAPVPASVLEGIGATTAYRVTRTLGHVATDALDVSFSVAGTAVRGTDYTLSAGVPPATLGGTTLTIPVGSASVDVFLDAADDAQNEPTETATFNLEPDPAGWYLRAAGLEQATVDVLDANPTVVGIASSGDATEHLVVDGWFTLTRTFPDLAIDVDYVLSGTAAPAQYLLSVASPIHFDAGQATVNVTVQMFDDHVTLYDQTLTMTLLDDVAAPDAYDLSVLDSATIVLHDNENAAVSVARMADAVEGGADGTFELSRDDPDMPIDVAYTLGGAALLGADYAAFPAGGIAGSVRFNAGQSTALLRIDAPGGDGDEDPESVVVALWPGSYYHVVAPAAATLTVIDTDPPNVVPDAFFAYYNCPRLLPAPGLLDNDPAPSLSTYTAVPDDGDTAQGGTYEVHGDGSVRYVPPLDFLGADGFLYQNTDGVDLSLPAAVAIDVVQNHRPAAAFSAPATALAGQGVAFVDASSDVEGPITAWTWDFGDGTTSPQPAALHTFLRPGTYVVRLSVEDGQCGHAYAIHTVSVGYPPADVEERPRAGPAEDGALIALAGADQQVPESSPVRLRGAVAGAEPGADVDFAWVQVAGPRVTLSDPAAAEPTFTAPDVPGRNATVLLEFRLDADVDGVDALPGRTVVEVQRVDAPPIVRTKPVAPVRAGASVNLDASASSDPDGDPLTFRWDQVEGTPATLSDAASALAAAQVPAGATGFLKFRVTVSDGLASRADTVLVAVAAEPVAPPAFTVRPLGPRPEDGYAFSSLTPGAVRWSFGDGGFAQGANATHAFAAGGTYTVTMVVAGPGGDRVATQDLVVPASAARPAVAGPVPAESQAGLWAALSLVALVAVLGGILLAARLLRRRKPRATQA